MARRTKIVATLGPATDDPTVLDAVLAAGVNVVRLNLSHGVPNDHLSRLAAVRSAAERSGAAIAVLADLPGPKIRTGAFSDAGILLEPGHRLRLRPGDGPSDTELIHVGYEWLLDDLRVGERLVVGDGALTVRIVDAAGDSLIGIVESGGRVAGRPGVHVSSDRLRLSSPTDRDLELADLLAGAGADFLAVSFVRTADDVDAVRRVVGDRRCRIIAKIETLPAVDGIEEIVRRSDGVMVARGDLGMECDLAEVPHLQKAIIRRCVEWGVPVITATQMLESMVTAPVPTRAEVSDVANAVLDGTDAVMLSGETAVGIDPANVVRTMSHIVERAEAEGDYQQWAERLGRAQRAHDAPWVDRITWAITHAASVAAREVDAAAILCWTSSGRTARAMARFRPTVRLVGLSPDASTVRSLALVWGVEPVQAPNPGTTDLLVRSGIEQALELGVAASGDHVLVLAGAPGRRTDAATDVLRLARVP